MASSRSILALVLTIACCMTAISAEESAESKEFVLTLDHSNFSDTVSKHNFIVVEFYAPWYTFNFSSFYFGSCLQFFFFCGSASCCLVISRSQFTNYGNLL